MATWLSVPLQLLSFVLEFNELNTFLKLNPKFNFNIILSSTIKSHAFIPYKKSCFYKMKSSGKRKLLNFCLRSFSRKYAKVFTENISETATDHISLIFLLWNPIIKIKFMVLIMHSQKDFNKNVIILICHICIWNLSLVWFLRTYLV